MLTVLLPLLLGFAGCSGRVASSVDSDTAETALPVCETEYYACTEPFTEPGFGEPIPIGAQSGPARSPYDTWSALNNIAAGVDSIEVACAEWVEGFDGTCPDQRWVEANGWNLQPRLVQDSDLLLFTNNIQVGPDLVLLVGFFERLRLVGLLVFRSQEHSALWCANGEFFVGGILYGDAERVMGCEMPPLPNSAD